MMRAAVAFVVIAAALGCRGVSISPPAVAVGGSAGETAVQVIHRSARTASGQLQPAAVGSLADAALSTVAPGQLPFDGWASLCGEAGRLVLVSAPRAGELAREIAHRWQAACPDREVTLLESDGEIPELVASAALLLVVAPAWAGETVVPDTSEVVAELRRAAWPVPRLVVVDLLEPAVGPGRWAADMVVAGGDAARVALATEYILLARARGQIPDLSELARRRGVPASEASWTVQAIFD